MDRRYRDLLRYQPFEVGVPEPRLQLLSLHHPLRLIFLETLMLNIRSNWRNALLRGHYMPLKVRMMTRFRMKNINTRLDI